MAYSTFKPIVTDGLVLNLDAANRRSFVSGSTVWNDLSGRGNTGTLNGPTGGLPSYSSANGGSIVFDGTDDYVNCGTVNSLGSNPALPFSVSVWVKKNVNGTASVFEKYQGITITGVWGWLVRLDQPSTNDVFLYLNKSQVSESVILATGVLSLNTWINITFTYDGSFGYLYINGVFKSSGATTGGTISTRNFNLGILSVNNGLPLNGNIGNVLGYTKTLSATEVLQNYNALKNRYI